MIFKKGAKGDSPQGWLSSGVIAYRTSGVAVFKGEGSGASLHGALRRVLKGDANSVKLMGLHYRLAGGDGYAVKPEEGSSRQ